MGYYMHPALLDCMLQLGASVPAKNEEAGKEVGAGGSCPTKLSELVMY
jgi:hypothetical protein